MSSSEDETGVKLIIIIIIIIIIYLYLVPFLRYLTSKRLEFDLDLGRLEVT